MSVPSDSASSSAPSDTTDPRRPARRARLLRTVTVLAVIAILLYAVSTPVLTSLGEQLIHSDPLERVDAMIVLAPGLDRVLEAAEVYRGGYAPVVVLTRERRGPAERLLVDRGIVESGEERRRQVLHALGVPLDAVVILDNFVNSTADEARGFAEWARSRPIRSVLVITSRLHTGRSRLTFLRALKNLQIKVLVRPSTLDQFPVESWWRSRDTLRDGVLEWQKLLFYRFVELPRLAPIPPSVVSGRQAAQVGS